MIGTIVESKRRWPPSAIMFLSIAACCALLALVSRKYPTPFWIGAALFGFAAIARLLLGGGTFRLEFAGEFFDVHPATLRIRYEDLVGIRSCGVQSKDAPPLHYPFEIVLDYRVIQVPARLTTPSREVEQFLLSKLPPIRLQRDPRLREYVERMRAEFGAERIWWTNGTPLPRRGRSNLRLCLTGILLGVASLIMLLSADLWSQRNKAIADAGVGMCGFAMIVGVVTAIVSLLPASNATAPPKLKNREFASVVVTPLGMAGETRRIARRSPVGPDHGRSPDCQTAKACAGERRRGPRDFDQDGWRLGARFGYF